MESTDNNDVKINKTSCQKEMKKTEWSLAWLQTRYPQTVGECFRRTLWQYVFYLAVFCWFLAYVWIQSGSMFGLATYVSFMTLLFLGRSMGLRQEEEKEQSLMRKPPDINVQISRLEAFADFPDIKDYISEVKFEKQRIESHKKWVRVKATLLITLYVAVLALIIWYLHISNINS